MNKETIVYGGKKYHRYPDSDRRQLRVYYWRHDKWKEPPFALHRQIWIDNNGSIPKGHVIHHIDGNPLDNEISNLEMILHSAHTRMHSQEPERRAALVKNGEKQTQRIIAAAEKYRRSKEGIEFARKNIKNSIHHSEPQNAVCLECGEHFTYVIKTKVKFCKKLCGARYRRKTKIDIV